MAIDLLVIPNPGRGFDPNNSKHISAVIEAVTAEHGTGWQMQSHDPATGRVTLSRQAAVTQVERDTASDSFKVGLERGTKPSDGDLWAARLEADPEHAGYVMVAFDPFLGEATLGKMSKDARRCRGAVANALRVKPWEVQVTDRKDGGFDLVLPGGYQPSKHDAGLNEVATAIVGKPGWYVSVSAKDRTASIVPGELPTFPPMVPYPLDKLKTLTTNYTPFGIALGDPGEVVPRQVGIDWKSSQFAMLGGLPGGGKRQPLTARVPVPASVKFPDGWATIGRLAVGDELYAVDGSITIVTDLAPIVGDMTVLEVGLEDGQWIPCDPGHMFSVAVLDTRAGASREDARIELTLPMRLRKLAASYVNAEGAPVTVLAKIAGIDVGEAVRFLSATNLPGLTVTVEREYADLHLPGHIVTRSRELSVYPVDEFLVGYADALDSGRMVPTSMVLTAAQIREFLEHGRSLALEVAGAIDGTDADELEPVSELVCRLLEKSHERHLAAIPPDYLRASPQTRLELLRRLMRARGRHGIGEYVFESPLKDATLANSVLELVRSLGAKARTCDGAQNVRFTTSLPIFGSVNRPEGPRLRLPAAARLNRIVAVRHRGIMPGRCIRVADTRHLYLTEGFVPTHNTVIVNAIIVGWLAAGGELVVADIPDKKSDFLWVKPWVRPGGWGCESDVAALAALSLVYEKGKERARFNEEAGASGWRDLPESKRYKPILVLVDELSGLIVTEKLPSGVPKDNPVVQRKIMSNLVRVSIDDVIQRLVREQRAMGMHALLSTQVQNNSTGLGPSVKALIGTALLQGANQTKTQRAQAFSSEDRVPQIPANVAEDKDASVGVGAAELAGQPTTVYKGYFASPQYFADALRKLGLPTTPDPEPSEADIARFNPVEEGIDDAEPPSRYKETDAGFGRSEKKSGPRVDGLSGAAAAAHDAAMEAAVFAREQRNRALTGDE